MHFFCVQCDNTGSCTLFSGSYFELKKKKAEGFHGVNKVHCSYVCLCLSKVFDMGEEEHDIILQKVQESKVSHSVKNSLFIHFEKIWTDVCQ